MLEQALTACISDLKSNRTIGSMDEASIKQAVVLKILHHIGWDTFDASEVRPEFAVAGRRVDFALRLAGNPKVFIEVKRGGEDLDAHQKQLLDYSFQQGIELAVLTNGATWWFYLPLRTGSWEQRKFYTIDTTEQEPTKAAERFIEFLSKENVGSGAAITNAERLYKSQRKQSLLSVTIPKAWNAIIEEPDEALIELLDETTEKLCGFKPDEEQVVEFIKNHETQLILPSPQPENKSERGAKRAHRRTTRSGGRGTFTGTSIKSFMFLGDEHAVRTWKDLLISISEILYQRHGKEFERVTHIRGRKRHYFSKNQDELYYPSKIPGTDLYVETNVNANRVVKVSRDVLALLGYKDSDLKINAEPK